MSAFLVKVLPILSRLAKSKIVGSVALLVLKKVVARTKTTLDDEILELITEGVPSGDGKASRDS